MQLITLLVSALLPDVAGDWHPIKLAGMATIIAPVELKLAVKSGDGKSAPKGLKYWIAEDGPAIYAVSFLPAKNQESKKESLARFSEAVAKPGDGRKTTEKWFEQNGHVGLDYTYKNGIGMAAKSAYRVDGWFLDAGVTWKAGEKVDFSRISKFLNSFAPTAKKK